MTQKTLALTDLENALKYWEDLNVLSELVFQAHHSPNIKYDETYKRLSAVAGSDVNEFGQIGRSIKSYYQLRLKLSGENIQHETDFMPRMPKSLKDTVEYQDWLNTTNNIMENLRVPYYLQSWSNTRKICQITEEDLIPPVNLNDGNYLSRIPYSCFVLSLTDEIILKYTKDLSFSTFIIKQEGDYLQIYSIPKINNEDLISFPNRQKAKAIISKKNNASDLMKMHRRIIDEGFDTAIDFFRDEFRISDGRVVSRIANDLTGEVYESSSDIYSEWGELYDDSSANVYAFTKHILEIVNGFCKLMSELPPSHSVHSNNTGEGFINNPSFDLLWNEVPVTDVKFLSIERDDSNSIVIRSSDHKSSEKSFHERRGHWRRILKKDGTMNIIWINKAEIRADKKADGVHGSATILA
jgi:hypothetical protein